ncbi:MAG TPA: zinc chelation protein SecC [Bacteroidetes bacterium]|nr:zinc chelation protein SecC [Bacteroidota bacterium]
MARTVNPYYHKEDETGKARVGTEKRPALVQVQSEQRAVEIRKLCEKQGWFVEIAVHADEPEEVTAIDQLLHPPAPLTVEKVGRNDPCPCGSGLKYKQCHGK